MGIGRKNGRFEGKIWGKELGEDDIIVLGRGKEWCEWVKFWSELRREGGIFEGMKWEKIVCDYRSEEEDVEKEKSWERMGGGICCLNIGYWVILGEEYKVGIYWRVVGVKIFGWLFDVD